MLSTAFDLATPPYTFIWIFKRKFWPVNKCSSDDIPTENDKQLVRTYLSRGASERASHYTTVNNQGGREGEILSACRPACRYTKAFTKVQVTAL